MDGRTNACWCDGADVLPWARVAPRDRATERQRDVSRQRGRDGVLAMERRRADRRVSLPTMEGLLSVEMSPCAGVRVVARPWTRPRGARSGEQVMP
jgi:hypothetical protein